MQGTAHIGDLLGRLASVPERIARVVSGWTESELRAPPGDGAWSAADILAHVRASDDIVTPRVYMMLVRDDPLLPAYDERRWAQVAGYVNADFRGSLRLFGLRRAELVAVLRRNAPADWDRCGRHEERGRVSVLEMVTRFVEHEEEHCAQLEAIRLPSLPSTPRP
jgi:hypothetical protein